MSEMKIITPTGMFGGSADDDLLDMAMRVIGVGFSTAEGEWAAKYGTNYENDVFSIHRYCWCESEECGLCAGTEPNFLFKPTGFGLSWYKYIGRGMEADGDLPADFLDQVFASHPTGKTLAEAIAETEAQEEATANSFAEMFASLGVKVRQPNEGGEG